jgi:hypothetical protein
MKCQHDAVDSTGYGKRGPCERKATYQVSGYDPDGKEAYFCSAHTAPLTTVNRYNFVKWRIEKIAGARA